MAVSPSQKVLFMGLGASGKTSIRSVIFDGKTTEDVADYSATINYSRSSKNLVGTAFQIFDCGGQESFISNFVGDQAEFIFSNVRLLIWVADVGDFNQVSTSKFYFDQAIEKLIDYSPEAAVFCLFHKTDLLHPDMKETLLENMQQYFIPPKPMEIHYRGTTIFDSSIFSTVGEAMRLLILQSSKVKNLYDAVQNFTQEARELTGIIVYTDDGLPILEAGNTDKIVVPANLWMSNIGEVGSAFETHKMLRSTMETDEFIFVFQKITNKLLLAGVTERVVPLHFVTTKIEQLANIVNELVP
ncbi:MAG: ADP-ribosylation factor-like protein [Candidatus Heimdallarchaeota archaeon]